VSTQGQKTKGLRIATRCTSLDQFVAAFHRFCDEQSFFVSTLSTRPVGLETAFSVDLVSGEPALRGLGVVLDAWSTADNKFGKPGVHLGIRRLTADAEKVFEKLLIARAAAAASGPVAMPVSEPAPVAAAPAVVPPSRPTVPTSIPPIRPKLATPPASPVIRPPSSIPSIAKPAPPPASPPAPFIISAPIPVIIEPPSPADPPPPEPPPPPPPAPIATVIPTVIANPEPLQAAITAAGEIRAQTETRAPASDFVLPANPLTGISDESLEGFVECTLFEETGNFFPMDPPAAGDLSDPVADPPPLLAPLRRSTIYPAAAAPADDGPAMIIAPPPPHRLEYPPPYMMHPVPSHPLDHTGQAPHWRSDRRLWVVAAGALALIVILGIVLASSGPGNAVAAPETAMPAKATEPATPVGKPPAATPTVTPTQARNPVENVGDEHDEQRAEDEAPSSGSPVIGKGPCRMAIETTPAGSTVALDGQSLGPSPLTIDGPCQKRQLTITHARYQPVTRWVAPSAGKTEPVEVVLPRPTHKVMIETNPLGATISIEGRRAGTSPTVVELMGFTSMSVTISKPGYTSITKRMYSKQASDKLFVRLMKK
jgi:hypothetical protein